ncbi:MAG TPA: type IV toxin-antitoxin system AbiEi family antitoxin domain-containing protein [Acidimicrobiales bacterium]|nr:type IV toxin-antitoxin system AbiEi family antitoxin domain-containing protein [Acidimicrobiales bacterium]
MNTDERIQMLAATQHGVVARRQLRELGVSRQAIRSRVAKGILLPHGPQALILAGSPPTWQQELMVALVDAGPGAAVSHESAAALLGLPGYWPGPVEISRQRDAQRGVPMVGQVHESRCLPAHHVTVIDGLRVTTLPRTLFDLAGVRGARFERTKRAVENAVSSNPAVLTGLRRMLDELAARGRPGIADMREILQGWPPGYVPPASGLEARAIALLEEAGIVADRQVDLGGENWIGRVDLRITGAPVVVEVDSVVHHTSPSDRERDQRRDAQLAELGLTVVRITEEDVFVRPWVVPLRVAEAIAAARQPVPAR